MPEPTVPRRPFSSFKVITYDIYGTLVDWETGLINGLQPLVARIPADSPHSVYRNSRSGDGRVKLAEKFNEVEAQIQAGNPSMKYSQVLRESYLKLASEFGDSSEVVEKEAQQFGEGVGSWPAFPDTVDACKRLSKYYKLIPVSNVDRDSFSKTCAGPLKGVDFFRVYTAQDIGSYKPDLRNFEYLLKHAKEDTGGVEKEEILHVAQSIFHDHVPAKKMGLSSVWINRKGAGMGSGGGIEGIHQRGEVGYGWKFATLGEFADEVERQRAEEQR
jgi:2-haloalkanoic acid dehalogenase type II